MERNFIDKGSGRVTKKDRVVFKLMQDRTIKIYHQKKRPLIEIAKKNGLEKKKKLFETGKEDIEALEGKLRTQGI